MYLHNSNMFFCNLTQILDTIWDHYYFNVSRMWLFLAAVTCLANTLYTADWHNCMIEIKTVFRAEGINVLFKSCNGSNIILGIQLPRILTHVQVCSIWNIPWEIIQSKATHRELWLDIVYNVLIHLAHKTGSDHITDMPTSPPSRTTSSNIIVALISGYNY